MNEKIKIFCAFLFIFTLLRIIYFTFLTLCDYRSYTKDFKIFVLSVGMWILGVFASVFSTLWDNWWLFILLTFLYFLFGGGIVVFITLIILSLIIVYLPAILMFLTIRK